MRIASAALLLLQVMVADAGHAGVLDPVSSVGKPPVTAPNAHFTSGGQQHSINQYKGRKVMLWLFSTWCHTCAAGVKALAERQVLWDKHGLVILAIKNYKNGGYPGPTITSFVTRFGPKVADSDNWVLGDASEDFERRYNTSRHPDIYFLIDEQGIVRTISTAPAATMEKMLGFVKGT